MIFSRWTRSLRFGARILSRLRPGPIEDETRRREGIGEDLAELLILWGPVYVKFGQILATRSDLVPQEVAGRLARLQDDVPPMPARELRALLARVYGRPIEEVFSSFELTPMASASIAQVHAATLPGGQEVVVKIVRPGVRDRMISNLRWMGASASALDHLVPTLRQLRIRRRFEELRLLLIDQTDLRVEARHQEQVRANFAGHPFVVVPRTYPELSGAEVLVMDRARGVPGRDARRAGPPPAQLARRAQEAIYTMLYFHGLCHADPHPGNVFVSEEGVITFIDFGIVARVSEQEKWALSAFFFACTRHEWDLATQRLTHTFIESAPQPLLESEGYRRDMAAVLRRHFEQNSCRWSSIAWFRDVNDVLIRYGVVYSPSFTRIELVFLSGEGFITQVDPGIDIWQNARRFNDRFSPYLSDDVKAEFDRHFGESNPGSMLLREQAAQVLVAQSHLDRCVLPSNYPLFIERAEGAYLYCVDGHRYIDLSCGYGPHLLGYGHPALTQALAEAAARGAVNALGHPAEVELARLILDALPGAERVVFSNSGTEAVLQALRLCSTYRRRHRVAKFEGHYHGYTDQGLVSSWLLFGGDVDAPAPVAGSLGCHPGVVEGTLVLQYGHPSSLARLRECAHELAAVILEPSPSALGDFDAGFLAELRRLCTELDLPLVFDEVVTGFRVAWGGVQTLAGVTPDLTCLGKIIGGSLPCGAVAGRRELIELGRTTRDPFLDVETRAFVSGTMSGNSLTCAAGAAALRWLRDHPEIYPRMARQTEELKGAMIASAARMGIPLRVGGARSIFSFSFDHRRPRFVREKVTGGHFKANLALSYYMRRRRVYLPELHTLMLSAAHTDQDLGEVAAAFDASLGEMARDGFFVL